MQKRNRSTSNPLKNQQYFLLEEIRGRWVSCGGDRCRMPEVHIYRTGVRHHRIEFAYDPNTVYNCPLWQRWGITFFYLYGRVGMSYDGKRRIAVLRLRRICPGGVAFMGYFRLTDKVLTIKINKNNESKNNDARGGTVLFHR